MQITLSKLARKRQSARQEKRKKYIRKKGSEIQVRCVPGKCKTN